MSRYKKTECICALLLFTFCVVCFISCSKNKTIPASDGTRVFYYNQNRTELTEVFIDVQLGSDTCSDIEALETAMKNSPSASLKTVFSDKIRIVNREIIAGELKVYFDKAYSDIVPSEEAMFRAAYVSTIAQIEEIDGISFWIEDAPLKNALGSEIGTMHSKDFVFSSEIGGGILYWEECAVYFSDGAGKLCAELYRFGHKADTSLEEAVVRKLIEGPKKQQYFRTLPEDTELVSISTEEGICKVCLKSEKSSDNGELALYSLVNSLCGIDNVKAVSIDVLDDGEKLFGLDYEKNMIYEGDSSYMN